MSSPEVSHSRVIPFFQYLKNETGYSFKVTNSTNISDLKKHCVEGTPGIVIVGSITAQYLSDHCNYKTIVIAEIEAALYKPNKSNTPIFENIEAIGFIRNSKLAAVAIKAWKSVV